MDDDRERCIVLPVMVSLRTNYTIYVFEKKTGIELLAGLVVVALVVAGLVVVLLIAAGLVLLGGGLKVLQLSALFKRVYVLRLYVLQFVKIF